MIGAEEAGAAVGLRRAVVRDAAWYGSAGAIAKVLALFTVPVLTRALEPSGYGLVDLATSTAALLTLLALLSADIPAARLSALTPNPQGRARVLSSYVWLVGGAAAAIALLLLPFAGLLAEAVWSADGADSLAILALVLIPVSALQAALAQTQRISSRARTFALLELADLTAQLGLAVLFVLLGLGPHGVLIGFILGSAVGLMASAAVAAPVLRARPDRTMVIAIGGRGLQLLPYAISFVVAEWLVRAVVANAIGVVAVADFGVAIRLVSTLTLIGAAFALAWGPVGLSRERGPDTARLFARALASFGYVSVAAALALGAAGPELVRIVAGEAYLGAAVILPAMAVAAAIAGAEYVLVVAASLGDNGRLVALGSVAGAVTVVVATAILVPLHGLGAVGPAALLGRATSFGILLVGSRSEVAYRLWPVIGSGILAIAAAGLIQLVIANEGALQWQRWLLAGIFGAAALVYGMRQLGLSAARR